MQDFTKGQTSISILKTKQYFMLRSRPPIVLEIDEAIAPGAPKRLEVKLPHNDMTRYEDRGPCQLIMRFLMEELLSRVWLTISSRSERQLHAGIAQLRPLA
jgi:hypothetical protein